MNRVIRNKIVVRHLTSKGIAQNQKELGEKMGYSSESAFSQVINEKVPEPKDFISKLKTFEPALNEEWLRTGEGEMLKVPATLTVFAPTDEERKEIGESVDMSVVPAEVVEEIEEKIKNETAVPIISPQIASCDNCDISEYLEEDNELEHFIPSDMTANVDGAEIVRRTSMLPTLAPNDIVFIKLINDKMRITDGGTYYFKLRKRSTMIRRVKIEGDKLHLIAQNPQYGDIITTFDDIINVASIEGMYRKNIANQYGEIEELRKKKDEQIDNLLLQNGGLIEQNGEALKIIRDLMKK